MRALNNFKASGRNKNKKQKQSKTADSDNYYVRTVSARSRAKCVVCGHGCCNVLALGLFGIKTSFLHKTSPRDAETQRVNTPSASSVTNMRPERALTTHRKR